MYACLPICMSWWIENPQTFIHMGLVDRMRHPNCVTLGRYSLALYFKVIIWTIVDLNGHNDCALHTFSGFLFYPTLLIWRSLGVVFPSISVQCYGTYKIMFLSWIFFSSQHRPFLNKHTYKSFSFSLSKFNWARDSHVRVKTDSLFLLYQPLPNL